MRLSSAATTPDPSRYHHGDLRRSLLAAARALAVEQGADALTLRAIARRAGVSHAAPAHHFPDKAALLDALAAEGFHRLAAALTRAGGKAAKGSIERLAAIGFAYVRFALRHPGEFELMYRPSLRRNCSPALGTAGAKAYQVLASAVAEAEATGAVTCHSRTTPGAPAAEEQALACWTAVHGFAVLVLGGLLLPSQARRTPTELLRGVLAVLAVGLEVR